MLRILKVNSLIGLLFIVGCSAQPEAAGPAPICESHSSEQFCYQNQLDENYIDDGVLHLFKPKGNPIVVV